MRTLFTLLLTIISLVAVYPAYAQEYMPKTLYIPALNWEYPVPIVEVPFENQQWDVSGLGNYIGHLEETGWMWGNTVLAGHINFPYYPSPFYNLSNLRVGDIIYVYDGPTEYMFYVRTIFEVDPSDIRPTAWTDDITLTLITCSDWDGKQYAKRLIVVAKLSL